MMRKDNRGLSLAELMIVVAIMAVITGLIGFGINSMSGRPAQQCAQKIIYSLERHRVTAMGKISASYTLKVKDDGEIECVETVQNNGAQSSVSNVIGSSRVTLFYDDGSSITQVPRNSSITLTFDRSSGAFSSSMPYKRLIVKSGGREYKIRLVQLTGKVYLE